MKNRFLLTEVEDRTIPPSRMRAVACDCLLFCVCENRGRHRAQPHVYFIGRILFFFSFVRSQNSQNYAQFTTIIFCMLLLCIRGSN